MKFQLVKFPRFVPNLVSFMYTESGLLSEAVPRIEIEDTDKLAFAAGLVILIEGAAVFIIIVWFFVVSRFPRVSLDLYLM